MARFGRTIYVTNCKGIGFDDNNNQFKVDIDIPGNVTDLSRANGKVRKRLNNNRILITEIATSSKYYSMTIDEFIDNASQVTDHK